MGARRPPSYVTGHGELDAQFHRPVLPSAGRPIETLADARAFILGADARAFILGLGDRASRNEWQYAIARLLECEQTGSCYAAREALVKALFLNLMLDLDQE
jgi:hypothetical protein